VPAPTLQRRASSCEFSNDDPVVDRAAARRGCRRIAEANPGAPAAQGKRSMHYVHSPNGRFGGIRASPAIGFRGRSRPESGTTVSSAAIKRSIFLESNARAALDRHKRRWTPARGQKRSGPWRLSAPASRGVVEPPEKGAGPIPNPGKLLALSWKPVDYFAAAS